MMRTALVMLVLLAVLLEGCSSAMPPWSRPTQTIVTVDKPIAAPCVDKAKAPALPKYRSDRQLAALDDYHATAQTWQQMHDLEAYALQADAVIGGCVK